MKSSVKWETQSNTVSAIAGERDRLRRDGMTVTVLDYVNVTAEEERNACQGIGSTLPREQYKKNTPYIKKSLNVIKHSDIH